MQPSQGSNVETRELLATYLGKALADPAVTGAILDGVSPETIDAWAIHPGGKSILDAVERGFGLPDDALAQSREVLRAFGNMSSATILFVLADMMARGASGEGIAIAFGPGLAAEAIRFTA